MLLHVRDSSKLSGNQKEMRFLLSICAPWCYLSENQGRVCMEKSLKIVRKSENAGINLMLCWKVVTANLHIYVLESTVYDSSYAERLRWLASLPWRDTCNYSPTMKNLTLFLNLHASLDISLCLCGGKDWSGNVVTCKSTMERHMPL